MSLAVDKFLECLSADGEWHSLNEVVVYLQLDKEKVMEIAKFFARFRFVQLDETQRKVKVQPNVRKLFASTLEEPKRIPIIAKR